MSICVVAFVVVACLALPARAGAEGWLRPVGGPVLRLFAVGPDRFAAGQHRGVDLAASPGGAVRAACSGRVSFAGRVPRGGRTVSMRCGPLVATYQHLGSVAVARGQVVVAGGRIGRAGGTRPRPHVHLGARVRATGAYVDPLALFMGAPRAAPPPLPAVRRPALPRAPRRDVRRPVPAPPAMPLVRLGPVAASRPLPAAPVPDPPAGRLPWPVWLGLALVAVGLPVGGLMRGRVRRRRRVAAPMARAAS